MAVDASHQAAGSPQYLHPQLPAFATDCTGKRRSRVTGMGPQQSGTSAEIGLPDQVISSAPLWTMDLPGRGTPVINGNKVYVLGYEGAGPDLQQVLRCVEADSRKDDVGAAF